MVRNEEVHFVAVGLVRGEPVTCSEDFRRMVCRIFDDMSAKGDENNVLILQGP